MVTEHTSTVYRTSDGKEFGDRALAEAHDLETSLKEMIISTMHAAELPCVTGFAEMIARHPKVFRRIFSKMFTILNWECPTYSQVGFTFDPDDMQTNMIKGSRKRLKVETQI